MAVKNNHKHMVKEYYKVLQDNYEGITIESCNEYIKKFLNQYPDVSLEMAMTTLMKLAEEQKLDEYNFSDGTLKDFMKRTEGQKG